MADLAQLGIEIDSRSVKEGVAELDQLTAAGGRAEGAVKRLGDASSTTGTKLRTASQQASDFIAKAQLTASETTRMAGAMGNMDSAAGSAAGGVSRLSGVVGVLGTLIGITLTSAVVGAVAALAAMAVAHFKASDAADAQAKATEELEKATNQLYNATIREMQSTQSSIKSDIAKANSLLVRANAARQAAVAELQLAKARLEGARAGAQSGEPGAEGVSLVMPMLERDTQRIDAEIRKQQALIDKNVATIRVKRGQQIQQEIEEKYDGVAAAVGKYERALDLLNNKQRIGLVGEREYRKELDAMTATREREEKAARDALKKPPKPKKEREDHSAERLAERLAREAVAANATITALDALAGAYLESDAAALKAEAGVNAAGRAIRKQGDVEAFVAREMRKLVAERAVDGARAVAGMRSQTAALKEINDAVASGALPASQAANALRDEAQLRPLIVAQAVAEGEAKEELAKIIARLRGEQAASNDEAQRAQVLAATASGADELERLRLEATLIGETNAVRAVALAQLQAEQFLRANPGASAEEAAAYMEGQKQIAEQAANNATAQDIYNDSLSYTADLLELIDERTGILADSLSSAFGNVGSGVGQAITALSRYAAVQAKLDKDHNAAVKAGTATEKERALYEKASKNAQLQGTMQVVAGLKSMFKEHSAGYKAMEAAERALAVIQLVQTAKSIAAGAAKMFAQLGVWAFPVVGAMIAVMAGLGFAGGGGSSGRAPTSAEDVQAAQGAGTVLGDTSAKSESIAHSLELVAANTNDMLEYDNGMLRALRSIDQGIGKLAASLAKELSLPGGAFDQDRLGLGTKSSGGFLGLFGSSTTKTLFDQGVNFGSTTLVDAIANGLEGSTYQIVEKVKKKSGFLGIGGGTKTSYKTTTGELDSGIEQQIGLILGSLRDSVVEAAKVLGLNVAAALNTFQVEIGKISFKDMNAEEITSTLQAVFSKVADQMAGFAVEGLSEFQKAGEGLFETLMRLAKDYMTIDTSLKSIGLTFGMIGASSIALRENLIDLFGSLEDFVDSVAFYQQNFLNDAQQIAPIRSSVEAELARLGLSSVDTISEFSNVVNGLDLTTEAGQATFAALMALAPAFKAVEDYEKQQADAAAQIAKQRTQLEIALMEAQGNAAGALAAKRTLELASMDESLRALQQQVWQAQDIASAKDRLSQAYSRERSELEQTINKFGNLSKSLRAFRDTLFGGAGGGVTYNTALAKLIATGALAASGDETGLGDLQGVSKTFLDVARNNASSLQQYQRDVALVARYVDGGISAAEGQKSTAERQLEQMETQVGALIDINKSVLSVKDAILQLNALMGGSSVPAPSTAGATTSPRVRRTREERLSDRDAIEAKLDTLIAATQQGTISSNRTARLLTQWDRGGSLAVATDDDTPLSTTVIP